MGKQQLDDFAGEVLARQDVTRALGRVFAESFAIYTVEVLRRLWSENMAEAPATTLEETLHESNGCLDDAPAWVREAHERAMQPGARTASADVVRPNVVRSKILLALHEKGWTQVELARRLKRSPTAVSRTLKHPEKSRVKTLQEIARVLDVDLSDVLYEK